MYYQHHNFHTTGINMLMVQTETCTDVSLLWSSHMAAFKSYNKIILETSWSHHVYQTWYKNYIYIPASSDDDFDCTYFINTFIFFS